MNEPRIDLVEAEGRQYLVSPAAPEFEFEVIPEDGTEESGLQHSIRIFKKLLQEIAAP